MRKIKLLLGASILLLSSQVNAGIISGATSMPGAELWKYDVRGSVSNDQGSLDIFGSMLIDTTVRDLYSPHAPRLEPCDGVQTFTDCQNFFHILSFDLRIGDLSFFGGGPFCDACGTGTSNANALFFDTEGSPGAFGYGARDWRLGGAGDYSSWVGQSHQFFNPDGTIASYSDIFQVGPAFIEMTFSTRDNVYMHLTQVARVPEPAAILLFGTGLIGLVGFSKRRKAA